MLIGFRPSDCFGSFGSTLGGEIIATGSSILIGLFGYSIGGGENFGSSYTFKS
jgi:hypothetical protein